MAKGFDQHQEYLQHLALLGKDLTRRSRARCELCQQSGVSLSIYVVPPEQKEPELAHVLHLCEPCLSQLERPKTLNPNHWRILSETAWSEVPAAQVMAVRILKHLAGGHGWAQEILEDICLEEDQEAWVRQQGIDE